MSRLRRISAVSFRVKVLVPVVAVMVLLLAVTAGVVNLRIQEQLDIDSARSMAAAGVALRDFQEFRTRSLLLRFHNLPNLPYYQAAFQHRNAADMRGPLNTLLAEQDVDIVLFSDAPGRIVASAKRDPLISSTNFETSAAAVTAAALRGEESVDTIRVGSKLYDTAAVPVSNPDGSIGGAMTVGSAVGPGVVEELGRITHSQIVLLANNRVVAATVPAAAPETPFLNLFNALVGPVAGSNRGLPIEKKVIGGEHFFCSAGRLASFGKDRTVGYLLLQSYEQPWRSLQKTREILLGISGLAILLGSVIVWFLIGKVTRPLRELRDSVEAVGRGDFSRRVEIRYEDECGELAAVFNRMTENLKVSHEQLELTVETLKTTQAQLIQSEKLSGIGEFIAGVAHELNNPLTAVTGFSELLRQAELDPNHKRYAEAVHRSALRCQKIVQALLGFARRRAPEHKPVCINGLIEAAMEMLGYQLRTSNIEVSTQLDPRLPRAMVDPHQIQQVFVNILNNARQAIEAHSSKGRIQITTTTRDRHVQVRIQDNGPGIPGEHLSKIFDPFFTTKEPGKGTGLGLSLCYGIIKEHGGTITPRSKPGEGTAFIIELPITPETAEPAADKPASEPEPPDATEGAGRRVLVIDDEEPILQMVRETLEPNGYEVDVAPDGETGLRRLTEKHYDLALCDWKMPGLNGRQVYEKVRSANAALSDRIIFITGDLISEKTRRFLEQQNRVCLPKPFTLAEFRAAIRKALARD